MSLIYLGNLFFTLQAENAGLLYLYIYQKMPDYHSKDRLDSFDGD